MSPSRQRHTEDDRGDIKIMLAVLAPVLVLFVGLVVDSGGLLLERNEARWAAEQAARAAAQQIDSGSSLTGNAIGINATRAAQAAQDHLALAGVQGTVTPVGTSELRVDTTTAYHPIFLPMEISCSGSATVHLTQEES